MLRKLYRIIILLFKIPILALALLVVEGLKLIREVIYNGNKYVNRITKCKGGTLHTRH